MNITFDLVVVNYKTLPYLRALLKTITETAPDAHVIVVDNDSADASIEWLAGRLYTTVILNDENVGFATACNQGAAAGTAEVVGFLNPDIILPDGWFYHIASAFGDPRVALAAPQLVDSRGARQPGLSRHWATAACLFLRRSAFDALGGFDENYFFGWEDIDLVRRAYMEGMVFRSVPEAEVRHLGRKAPRPKEWGGDYDPESRAYFEWRWKEMKVLKYIGKGAFHIGVPSRDLTAEDMIQLREAGWTIKRLAGGERPLYERVEPPKPKAVIRKKRRKRGKGARADVPDGFPQGVSPSGIASAEGFAKDATTAINKAM